jgi:adenylylsulfate kinase
MAEMKKGFCIWITGLPGSGKTTIASALTPVLENRGLEIEVFDGDWVRKELSPDLGFSKEDRELHNRRVIHMTRLLVKHGVVVIVCLISPYREVRQYARERIREEGGFVEVWAKADIQTCIKRDPKGLYAKALKGEIPDMTGIQHPYQEPLEPEVTIDTEAQSPVESAETVVERLIELGHLSKDHRQGSRTRE